MGALERERPSAGSNGLCSVKPGLLQEKNLPFGAWSHGGPSEQRGTARQDIAHAGWEQATRAVYHLPPNPNSDCLS